MKFIRLDADHFVWLVDQEFTVEEYEQFKAQFDKVWPDKRILVITADEFIDVVGDYEIVRIGDLVPA